MRTEWVGITHETLLHHIFVSSKFAPHHKIGVISALCDIQRRERRERRERQSGTAKESEDRRNAAPAHSSNKKLLGTSASLLVTSALLVVTRSY